MPLSHVSVVLVRPQQAGNIGVAARAVANHGLGQMVLVAPPGFDPDCCRWLAASGAQIVDDARLVHGVQAAVAHCDVVLGTTARTRRSGRPTLSLDAALELLRGAQQPCAVLFGPEDYGLSSDDLIPARATFVLPTTDASSINLGQAVSIFCAHLRMAHLRQKPAPVPAAPPVIHAGLRAALVVDALESLECTNYLAGRSRPLVEGTLTRALTSARLTEADAKVLRGMLKSVRWQLKNPSA